MERKIRVNGQEYGDVRDMPEDVRRLFEQAVGSVMADADRNGVPDLLEGRIAQTSIRVNDQVYDSVEKMPADIRRLYEQALKTARKKSECVVEVASTREISSRIAGAPSVNQGPLQPEAGAALRRILLLAATVGGVGLLLWMLVSP